MQEFKSQGNWGPFIYSKVRDHAFRQYRELRKAFAAAFQPELLDAAAQGAGIKFQNCRGAVGTLDAPVGLFEDLEDAFFLGLSERTISRSPRDIDFGARTGLEGIGGRCDRNGRNQFRGYLQLGSPGQNDRAFDYVFQLSDIAR